MTMIWGTCQRMLTWNDEFHSTKVVDMGQEVSYITSNIALSRNDEVVHASLAVDLEADASIGDINLNNFKHDRTIKLIKFESEISTTFHNALSSHIKKYQENNLHALSKYSYLLLAKINGDVLRLSSRATRSVVRHSEGGASGRDVERLHEASDEESESSQPSTDDHLAKGTEEEPFNQMDPCWSYSAQNIGTGTNMTMIFRSEMTSETYCFWNRLDEITMSGRNITCLVRARSKCIVIRKAHLLAQMLSLLLSSLEGHTLGVIRALVRVQVVLEPVIGGTGVLRLRILVADGTLDNAREFIPSFLHFSRRPSVLVWVRRVQATLEENLSLRSRGKQKSIMRKIGAGYYRKRSNDLPLNMGDTKVEIIAPALIEK
uniref:Uncharacterized protein n=1 Tax=Pristionchus pacificus TaxID=54126 RepID=A0A2A6BU17_PRIPA|eukprot:PDM69394.1 hypothetical protein PRIPAC_47696 [Pristionchus pacificus]